MVLYFNGKVVYFIQGVTMNKRGFTMVELLVVVMIMATLTAIMIPQYRRAVDRSKAAEVMQVLPALFEARERWVLSNLCTWENGALSCDDAVLKASKLDIQVPGTITDNTANNNNGIGNIKIQTEYFDYFLVTPEAGLAQPCVSAKPRWGSRLGLGEGGSNTTAATIYFRGDKFSCVDGTVAGGCDILNVTPDDAKYRVGCI